MKTIKIAYLGGGSKLWARSFMQDLALAQGIRGEVSLYDIVHEPEKYGIYQTVGDTDGKQRRRELPAALLLGKL